MSFKKIKFEYFQNPQKGIGKVHFFLHFKAANIINVERRLLPNLPTLIKKVYRKATLIF